MDVSLPSSFPSFEGRSSGRNGRPPLKEEAPHIFCSHFVELLEADRCVVNVVPYRGLRFGEEPYESSSLPKLEVDDRGRRKSGRRLASTVTRRGAVVERDLVLGDDLIARGVKWVPRGAAWPNMKPGLGLGLKKQISDCDLRNLRRLGDGTGVCRAGLIAARNPAMISSREPDGCVLGGCFECKRSWKDLEKLGQKNRTNQGWRLES